MSPEQIGKLRVTTTKQSIASRNVTTFRIYDSTVVNAPDDKITYEGLSDRKDALQFQGTFASNKTVTEIQDLRRSE